MANEDQKFREAAYFFGIMKSNLNDRTAFVYNFSAFITASRSVVQYTFEECKSDKTAKEWYDDYVSRTDLIRYFKNIRDVNIHEEPVVPGAVHLISGSVNLTVSASCSVKVIVRDSEGNRLEEPTPMSEMAEKAIA
ncbi:MAG: hypothetical protein ABIK07_24255, partial [Planctomycetota bacterium]